MPGEGAHLLGPADRAEPGEPSGAPSSRGIPGGAQEVRQAQCGQGDAVGRPSGLAELADQRCDGGEAQPDSQPRGGERDRSCDRDPSYGEPSDDRRCEPQISDSGNHDRGGDWRVSSNDARPQQFAAVGFFLGATVAYDEQHVEHGDQR